MDTTRTVSSSRAAASKSFNTCWTVPACEIPCSSTVWTKQRPEPVSRDGRHRSGSPLGQPPPGSVRVRSVADSTLRGYVHDLLHFLRWWVGVNQTEAIAEGSHRIHLAGLHSFPDQSVEDTRKNRVGANLF